MAVEAPLLSRRRVFACKVESTTGTAESLTAAEGKFNIHEAEIKPDIEMSERFGQSSFSRLAAIHGGRGATMTLKNYLTGEGAVTPTDSSAQTLFRSLGFSYSSGTMAPVTSAAAYTSLTMGHYVDGRLFSMSGSVGKLKMPFKSGQPCLLEWEHKGIWQAPSATAIIAPTYPTIKPPRFASATLTFGGSSYKVSEVTIEIENELYLREDATKASGYHSACIVDRTIKVSADPEALALGTKDWYADWLAHTEAALNLVIGSEQYNTITITAPKLQPVKVEPGDRDGVHVDKLEWQANRSAAAGDDELGIVFA